MNKSETIEDLVLRLRECANICGGVGALAQKSAIPRRTIDSYLAGGSEPKWSNLKAIGEAAGVSFDWLVAGVDATAHSSPVKPDASAWDGYALIPGYNIQVSAGNGAIADGEEVTRRLAFRRNWLNYRGLCEKNLVVVFAKGDSMEPTISDKNTIMVDTSDATPQDGRMYVIRVDEHLLVKRTQIVPGQGVMLISDNKDYPAMMVKCDEFNSSLKVVGRVVWIGKDV